MTEKDDEKHKKSENHKMKFSFDKSRTLFSTVLTSLKPFQFNDSNKQLLHTIDLNCKFFDWSVLSVAHR